MTFRCLTEMNPQNDTVRTPQFQKQINRPKVTVYFARIQTLFEFTLDFSLHLERNDFKANFTTQKFAKKKNEKKEQVIKAEVKV